MEIDLNTARCAHLQDVGRGDVNFGDDNDNGDFQCDSKSQVLSRHPRDSHIRPNQDKAVI
jgi:hypothetical protein